MEFLIRDSFLEALLNTHGLILLGAEVSVVVDKVTVLAGLCNTFCGYYSAHYVNGGSCGEAVGDNENADACPYLQDISAVIVTDQSLGEEREKFRKVTAVADTYEVIAAKTGNDTVITYQFLHLVIVVLHDTIAVLSAYFLVYQREVAQIIVKGDFVIKTAGVVFPIYVVIKRASIPVA